MLLHFAFYTLLQFIGHKWFIGFNEDSIVNGFTFYILHCTTFLCLMLLQFAFYTLLHPIGPNYSIGLMKTQEWMVLDFTFYILQSFHALLSTDWVSLNYHKWKLLHFAFYTLLQPMCRNCSICFIEDLSVNDFTFHIALHFIIQSFHALLSTDWVSLNFHNWMLLYFAFYTLLHSIGHNCSIKLNEDSRMNEYTF